MSSEARTQARERALADWFGDSKVRQPNGIPRVMYHGTSSDFKVFRPSRRGEYGAGIYCTSSVELANEYGSGDGGNVMPLYVQIANPIPEPELNRILAKFHDGEGDWTPEDISDGIEMAGYDGILLERGGEMFAMALQPTQIKSAIGNNGTYDRLSPDLRFSQADGVAAVSSTPDAVREAIAELVGVDGQQLQAAVGKLVVTTSDQVASQVEAARKAAFEKWFEGSAVRDEGGQPLRVYHGSTSAFTVFDKSMAGKKNGRSEGVGFYFTTQKKVAQSYAENGNLYEVFLAIKKPLAYDAPAFNVREMTSVLVSLADLEAQENESDWRDGFLANWVDSYSGSKQVVAQAAARKLTGNSTALDQLGSLISSGVSPTLLNSALMQSLGYDGYVAKGYGNDGGAAGLIYVAMEPWQIKSALGDNLEFNKDSDDIRHSFFGVNAKGLPEHGLESAKRCELAGDDAELIRQQTGWHRGLEGKWRYEISDQQMSVNTALLANLKGGGHSARAIEHITYRADEDGTYRLLLVPPSPQRVSDLVSLQSLGMQDMRSLLPDQVLADIEAGAGEEDFIGADFAEAKRTSAHFAFGGFDALPLDRVIDHPALFDAYPSLRDVMVRSDSGILMGAHLETAIHAAGEFSFTVALANPLAKNVKEQLIHEIQHAVQYIEGFALGGSVDQFKELDVTDVHVKVLNQKLMELLDSDPKFGALRREHTRDWIRIQSEFGSFEDDGRERLNWDDVPTDQRDVYFARMDKLQEFPQSWEYMDVESERRRLIRDRAVLSASEQYRRLAGEVEARNTENRLPLTEQERRMSPPEGTEDVPRSEQGVRFSPLRRTTQAFHDLETDVTYFLADRIPAGKEASVFLHETVHRHGKVHLAEGQFDALVGQVQAWARHSDGTVERSIHDKAAGRVAAAGVSGPVADEELFAYAVEEAVAMGVQPSALAHEGSAEAWLQAVVQSIQRVADKLIGNSLEQLDGQDLVDLAYALAQVERPELGAVVAQTLQDSLQGAVPAPQQGLDEDRTPGGW